MAIGKPSARATTLASAEHGNGSGPARADRRLGALGHRARAVQAAALAEERFTTEHEQGQRRRARATATRRRPGRTGFAAHRRWRS